MKDNRRDFLKKGALLGLTGLAGSLIGKKRLDNLEAISETLSQSAARFVQQPLPYAYNALEPFIDARTMEIHYSKHHKGYVDKLNEANLKEIDFNLSDADKCRVIHEKTPALIRNNLGGHYNHTLFWELMRANTNKEGLNAPEGKLADAINREFVSFDRFKDQFADAAAKIFGSGWCWLVLNEENKLSITTTPNQDNPLMSIAAPQKAEPNIAVSAFIPDKKSRLKPVLALDVWEHAYYLKHQNKRADYIKAWWSVVNWKKADELYLSK